MTGQRRITFVIMSHWLLTAVIFCAPVAIFGWNHTEIQWKTLETEHFSVHFYAGEEWSARETARIAEEIYGPVTELYGQEMGRVHIIVKDRSDVAEGMAYFYLNRVDINAADYEFHLRGTADWLRNVVTHEFTHLVSIQAAMKIPRQIPALYLQAINFEKERRPGYLTGYPNFQGSLPLSSEIVPNWLSEGMAQYQCLRVRNDIWDSHRDMILRCAVLNDNLLSMDELGVFGKNSLEAEKVYNQGYSLVRFIGDKYGEASISSLIKAHKRFYYLSFNGACRKELGISEGELYRSWKEGITSRYRAVEASLGDDRIEGERISRQGFLNLFPLCAGEKGEIFHLSNRGSDYMGLDLVRVSAEGKILSVVPGVCSRPALSSDGKYLTYGKCTQDNDYGYRLNDVYIWDLDREKERRLTYALRATDPVFSPDGDRIAAVSGRDGSERVVLVNTGDGKHVYLTDPVPGRRYYGLCWGEKGILASRFDGLSRHIVLIDPASGREEPLICSLSDERDPCWDGAGEGLFYASDRTGIFNIHYRDLRSGDDFMITNTIGGAFTPAVAGENLLFSAYGDDGYEIRVVRKWRERARPSAEAERDEILCRRRQSNFSDRPAQTGPERSALEMELDEKVASAEDFKIKFTPLYIFPRLLVYDNRLRLGVAFDSRDYLDRQSVYAAASINREKEYNLLLHLETRQFKPTISFDIRRAMRYHHYQDVNLGKTQRRYDLWEAFFTTTLEFAPPSLNRQHDIALRYNHGEFGENINAWETLDREYGWNYYKADEISLFYNYRNIKPGVDADINPGGGAAAQLEVSYALGKLASGEFEYGFKPIYNQNKFIRYMATLQQHFTLPLWIHTLEFFSKFGVLQPLDDKKLDDFYYLFLGSRDGMRGYTYFGLGGNQIGMARLTYRFPIWRNINRQVYSLYFGSLYGGLFTEAGKAWTEDYFNYNGNQKDIGFELRLKGFSFYNYPLAVSLEGAYGFNQVRYDDPFDTGLSFIEGKEWRYYGMVFFNF
ncbi:MAG: PD40 domain-containing protein [Candidatus Krumholzibacteriota bacterium]|nr:PD40 domain-containing protein [Candidatus Krumholzibacteriota bacterium]